MWSEEIIQEYLKNNLKPTRYEHSVSVRGAAIKLAEKYGACIDKARIAGLVHDCAKNLNNEELLNIAKSHGYTINDACEKNPQLLHGIVGAIIAKEKMEVEDDDVLNAIRYHTTGKKDMSILEKIIYIADYIEPLRNFPGVTDIRKVVYQDLDKALLESFNKTIKFVIDKGEILHTDTVEARNYIIYKISR
ncbi:putative nicotinate-nucleotide adenylyltransferase [Clostridium acetireducens DSM 10703]|uniref:bis(5'-nucleosyl)-tetraphosphatase (symmetrical) n=1 Tax=Clostridium acetireducens DSM 10703 TaxID=1121290 RepID=A0A1E8F216_9CLOT|nr:bis(5'-nucleosyl)-tetraphosphatase (symmetrical) YqeK [Clostridium acetireducens]OFI07209.1 putative nicotinate-nucleotide adenylyltransferase [Clostridium acetireducens DSM 10703]